MNLTSLVSLPTWQMSWNIVDKDLFFPIDHKNSIPKKEEHDKHKESHRDATSGKIFSTWRSKKLDLDLEKDKKNEFLHKHRKVSSKDLKRHAQWAWFHFGFIMEKNMWKTVSH